MTAEGPTDPDAPNATPLLPCLKEAKWPGRGETVCRALWEKRSSPYMPWVAVGYDHPHTFEFINTRRLAELNTTEQALEAQAIATLCARPATWQSVSIDVKGTPLVILTFSGDYYAAERILDAAFMQQAQQMLKAPVLFVGVPRRGLLMACAGTQDHQIAGAFGVAVAGQYSRAETALISPMMFAVKNGVIVGILEEVAEAIVPDGEPKGAPGAAPAEEDPDAPYVSAMVSRNDSGTEDVHLMAGGQDGLQLAKAIEKAFMALFHEHVSRPEFSGHIQIVVLGMTPPPARKQIPSLLEHLRGICNDLSRGKDKRYRVTLTYQKDSLASAAEAPVADAPKRTETPKRLATAPAVAPSASSRPAWLIPALLVAAIVVGAGAYLALNRGTSFSYPDTLVYGDVTLQQAGDWDRDGTSAVVYLPAGESIPSAPRQVGIITSTKYTTTANLLFWIVGESKTSGTHYHDLVANNERCFSGVSDAPGGPRTFLSLQTCKAGATRAGCIELDQAIDPGVAASCLNRTGCFQELCNQHWLEERPRLEQALTTVMSR